MKFINYALNNVCFHLGVVVIFSINNYLSLINIHGLSFFVQLCTYIIWLCFCQIILASHTVFAGWHSIYAIY